jgi:tRNA A37 threonylcarbamoyltransferase TsaD
VVIRSLVGTTDGSPRSHQPRTLIVAGGVACNEALREASRELGL